MSRQEYENVCKFLMDNEIQLSLNNSWLKSCIDLYKRSIETKSTYRSLNEYVCIQWLLADLQDVQHSVLPINCVTGKTELTGKYSVQINWMRDIGQSCYSQLQAAQNIKESESNDFVSVDKPKVQGWEPKSKRVLMMEITDGVTVVKAMEYSPIEKLDDNFLPGMKVSLIGPIECRNGILFLKNINISLLGGEVEILHEKNTKQYLLSRCLNIPESIPINPQPPLERSTNIVVESSSARRAGMSTTKPGQITGSAEITNEPINQLPDSTSTVESIDVLMTDEDDEFLNQLPDDILYNTNSFNPEPSNVSPILNERPVSNESKQTYINWTRGESSSLESRNKHSEVLRKPKPRLFPSLEDLNSNEEKSVLNRSTFSSKELLTKSKESTLQTSGGPGTSFSASIVKQENTLDETYPSSTSLITKNIQEETIQKINELSRSIDGAENNVYKIKFPQRKQVLVKLESVEKIKIKNSEWYCCAIVLVKEQSLNVIFCDKVCEKIMGISAFGLEKLRGQMATDQNLKSKVNSILKAGQTKLMSLNCTMTIEYSSEDCTPEVVSIDEV